MSTAETSQPVTQITIVEPGDGETDHAIGVMRERANFMAGQPGFISISIFRSDNTGQIVNLLRWQDLASLQAAHATPEFQSRWSEFGESTRRIDPEIYQCVVERPGSKES